MAAGESADPRKELLRDKGIGHIVVRAPVEALDFIEDNDVLVLLKGGVEPVFAVVRQIFFGMKQFEERRCEAALIFHQ